MRTTPFRIKLIAYFFGFLLLTAGSLIYVQYHFIDKLASQAAQEAFENTLDHLNKYQTQQAKQSTTFLDLIESFPGIDEPVKLNRPHPLQEVFIKALSQDINAYALYWANLHGDFFEVINMHHSPLLPSQLKAPSNSRWGLIKLSPESDYKIKHYQFLDENLQLISSRDEATDYKAYRRPWFTDAQQAEDVTRSAPYLFQHLQLYGITYSKFLPADNAVIAIDYTNTEIETFLHDSKPSKGSYIFLFDEHHKRMIDSDTEQTSEQDKQVSEQLYNQLKPNINFSSANEALTLSINDKTYLARFIMSQGQQQNALNLAMLIPKKDLTEPYTVQIQLSLIVASGIIILLVPVIFFLARILTRPINELMAENKKIQKLQFDQVRPVPTTVKELAQLSDSLVNMSNSIQQYQKSQAELLDGIIELIADAIDTKSPYTGGHCKRVPKLAISLLDAANKDQKDFQQFQFNDAEEIRAFKIGAWLHDCGKITTPEYVVDKATKLETLYNRIHEIRTRFEVLWRDTDIAYYQACQNGLDPAEAEQQRQQTQKRLQTEFAFIANANVGGEYLSEDDQARIHQIGKHT